MIPQTRLNKFLADRTRSATLFFRIARAIMLAVLAGGTSEVLIAGLDHRQTSQSSQPGPAGADLSATQTSAGKTNNDSRTWGQWRGPRLDNVSPASGLPADLNGEGVLKWRIELPGPAGSSPIVWEDKIFLTSPEGTQVGAGIFLFCFDDGGKLLWKQLIDDNNQNYRDNANAASPSPITDGQFVWAQSARGILHCFSVDGDLSWKKDLQSEYGRFDIQFGLSSTPVLDEGRLYLQLIHGDMRDQRGTSEGHVIALDAATGRQIWYQKRLTDGTAENKHSYASPTIYRDNRSAFLITHGADFVIGHSLLDGTELWRVGGMNIKGPDYNPYLRFVASPTAVDGMIVVPTAKRGPVLALRPNLQGNVTADGSTQIWKLNVGTPDVASPLIFEDHVYLADERGVLVCLNAKTGAVLYQQRLMASNHRSTPVAADGKIYLNGRDGEVYVIKPGSQFKLLSKRKLDEELTASPAVVDGRVYIRTFAALYAFGE